MTDVDEALDRLGKWGRWQIIFYLVLCITCAFPSCWHMLAINFIGGKPEHHCKLPEGALKNETIPMEKDGYSKCEIYVSPDSNDTEKCSEWVYFGDVGDTIVNKWDLVCDRKYWTATSQTIMIVGVMIGAMGFSALSDYIGRKPVFLFSQWAMVIIGIANAFVPNLYGFLVLRFITGALQQGIVLTGFVMTCELFSAKRRTFAGMILQDFWAVATCILAGLAYLIRDWVYLQLVITVTWVVTVPLFWFLPESIPWLCANDHIDKAEKILHKAAKMNGVAMPDPIFSRKDTDPDAAGPSVDTNEAEGGKFNNLLLKLNIRRKPKKQEKTDAHVARYTLLDVFRNRRLTIYTICMSLLWMVNTLVYYGLSLSASQLAGDRYLNNFLSGLVEIPAYLIAFFVLQKWGRRRPLIAFHIIAGVGLLLSQVVPDKSGDTDLVPLQITFTMVGKFGITATFGTVFLYAPEIFPTTLRSQAMGIASLMGRVGNMIAPQTSLVVEYVSWLPGLLFGALSIGGGLLTLFLPETHNRPLPQTIEDIENWSKKDGQKSIKRDEQEMTPAVKS